MRRATGYEPSVPARGRSEPANLADILERVLDKGIVIAGDIQVNLLDIELLTIKLRLVIASVDRAKEMGIDWWEHDPTLSSGSRVTEENRRLRERITELERRQEAADRPDELPEATGAWREPHERGERYERGERAAEADEEQELYQDPESYEEEKAYRRRRPPDRGEWRERREPPDRRRDGEEGDRGR